MKLAYRELNIIIMFITLSGQAYDASKFAVEIDAETPWRNILSITKLHQTIFLDIDNANSGTFKDSILRNIHIDQCVILVSGTDVPDSVTGLTLRSVLMRSINTVFITNSLNASTLDSPLVEFILRTHWSVLFILVTTEDKLYNCDDGKFSAEAINNIEEFLGYLWYKHRVKYVFLNLPYVCPEEYVVYNGTKQTDGEVYNRTIKQTNTEEQFLETLSRKAVRTLTQNYPLRGNIFYRFPTAIQDCTGTDIYIKTNDKTSGGFCGMDGLIMSDVVRHFGFNLSLPTLAAGYNKYGYEQQNGYVTGILGHIVRRNVDVSFNSRFLTKYTTGLQNYQYLYPVSNDALCAVLKQPDVEPLWQYPIKSYRLPEWLLILACLTGIGVLMWISARIRNTIHNTKASRLLSYILNSTNAGLFGSFLKRRKDLLIFRAACLFASIIVLATYQSHINYMFTTCSRYAALNTLSDLAESGTVIQTSPSIYGFINESVDELRAIILSHTIVLEGTDSFKYVLQNPNTATLERKTDTILKALMNYSDEGGRPLLYVSNECFRSFYLSYIAHAEFPFHGPLYLFTMWLAEAGLPEMYYTWTSRALGLEVTLPSLFSEPRPAYKITMSEQVIAFSLLLVGYNLSVIALAVEIWWARRSQAYPFMH